MTGTLPAAARLPVPDAVLGHRFRILLADDNVDAATMLKGLLETGGHEVDLAYDGKEALSQASANPYDLVILDLGMPHMSGDEVAIALRKMPRHASTFMVALSGWGAEEDRIRTRDAGFDAHLTKPAGKSEIRKLLVAMAGNRPP